MSLERDVASPLHVDSFVIAEHVGQETAIAAARLAAEMSARGTTKTCRATLPLPHGWMRLMASSATELGVFGYKEFHLGAANAVRYAVHLFDLDGGQPLGVVDAALITTMRTAATAGVALEHMVGPGAMIRVAVVGTGAEAFAGLEILAHLFDVVELRVTSRREKNRDKFLARALKEIGVVGVGVDSPQAACASADVVYVATNSNGMVVATREDLRGVPYIASIGSTLPQQRELDGAVLVEAGQVIVDTWDVLEESGDAIVALDMGLDRSRVQLLGAAEPDSTGDSGPVVYKSIGSPEQDLVLAAMILDIAKEQGLGRAMEPLSAVKFNL